MRCLEDGSPDPVYRSGGLTGISKGFKRADLFYDLVDLVSRFNAQRRKQFCNPSDSP